MKGKIGFEIKLPEGSKIVKYKLSDKAQEYLNKNVFKGKNHLEYLEEFLITKNNFKVVSDALFKAMEQSLPTCLKSDCPYCKGESNEENDMLCTKYILQMRITFSIAAEEFINLIFNHKHIYQNKKALLNVTQDFYRSFVFIKNKGLVYFDLDNICRCILNAGFISLSEMFSKSEPLTNLKVINEHIDYFEDKLLENEILNSEDENYLDLQKRFFENKQKYYKEKLFLHEKEANNKSTNIKQAANSTKKISIPTLVMYYYYLQEAKDFPFFDNHPEGKLKAIEELIKKDKINTSAKNFQLEYNKIAHHKSNRIANNKASNILFVANTMLTNYPNAKKIALKEYDLAINKNR